MRRNPGPCSAVIASLVFVAACGQSPVEPAQSGAAVQPTPTAGEASPEVPRSTPSTIDVDLDAVAAATAVVNAVTDDARRDGILALLTTIGIGVYGGDGTPVVIGAERSPDDFWIYDFEVAGLAAAIGDDDLVSLVDLASDLAAAGVQVDGVPITGAVLVAGIERAMSAAAADPANPNAYSMLAVRALGSAAIRPGGVPPGTVPSVDQLTGFLVLADLLLPTIAAEPAHAAAPHPTLALARPEVGSGLLAGVVRTAAGACDQIASRNQRNAWSTGQLAQALAGGVYRGMPASSFLHAFLMNAMLEARVQSGDFHLGHDARTSPPDQALVVTYSLRINPGRQAVECGLLRAALLGIEGGIKSMPVTWSYAPMESFGEVWCIPRTCDETDAAGKATLRVVPKTEKAPAGIGPEVHETVPVTATGDVFRALGPDLFTRLQGAPARKVARFDVDVSYHREYDLFLDVKSRLRIWAPAPYQNSEMAIAEANGDLDIKTARASTGAPIFAFEVDTLKMETWPQGVEGTCSTAVAKRRTWDSGWMVLDAVVYPANALLIALDSPVEDPVVDAVRLYLCDPKNNLIFDQTEKETLWESWLFRGHLDDTGPHGGLQFTGSGREGWTYLATDTTWTDGGRIATWHSTETCAGTCTGTLDMELWVSDVRLP
jgi:hypothetical protein